MNKDAKDYLIVALDVPTLKEAEDIVDELGDLVGYYKVGLKLFLRFGPNAIEILKDKGKKVFLDLKLHDIPSTVAGAVDAAVDMNLDMLTVHALGGFEMMETAQKIIWERKAGKPLILGVTILTSLDEAFLQDFLGIDKPMEKQILDLAVVAKSAGLRGVVASPKEVSHIKKQCGKDFIVVTPGIRPKGAKKDDQKRVLTPDMAIIRGADFIVVGRTIINAPDRGKATLSIIEDIGDGLHKVT
ncbi:orotidine-5'-phosphate decarboxylase [candidate division WOR-3 bacterium]|nr:orotidine-5'-phosphate decarboxylase [candidate division WOR-3 bacterium]